MESSEILGILKELTLDLEAGKRKRAETVAELHRRIDAELVYDIDGNEPQREFITQVFVSLDNLTDEDFPPSAAEMQYFAECFRGQREFRLAEVREFELISTAPDDKPERAQRPKFRTFKKGKPGRSGEQQSQIPSKINRVKPVNPNAPRPTGKDKQT